MCREEKVGLDRMQLVGTAHDIVDILLVDNNATLGTPSLGAELGTEVVDVDFAVAELFHRLETIPVVAC